MRRVLVVNEFRVLDDETAELVISRKGKYSVTVLIDAEEVGRLSVAGWRWYIHVRNGYTTIYGRLGKDRRKRVLSRLLLGAPDGYDVDHINHNSLDNTKINLRLATKSENGQNRKGATCLSKSGVRGVSQCSRTGKWTVRVKEPGGGPYLYFGRFDTIAEAEVVAKKARSIHQPFSEEALVA